MYIKNWGLGAEIRRQKAVCRRQQAKGAEERLASFRTG